MNKGQLFVDVKDKERYKYLTSMSCYDRCQQASEPVRAEGFEQEFRTRCSNQWNHKQLTDQLIEGVATC